ncbi:MAG: YvcK family protein [Patescibacteria group bacterium]|nr:YvcK family protein [Patescibacteria group bacterium]
MTIKKSNKKIVVIGGGTGVFTVLTGLKPYFDNLTAIVTMADDGGSTGILREEFGILPPGDIRRALIALSATNDKMLAQLFSYRFERGLGLAGHSFGNLLITVLERITKNFEEAVNEAGKILSIKGRVIPVTLGNARLVAELENGQKIMGETNIDIPKHDGNLRIKNIFLRPAVQVNPNAKKAIMEADIVIIGPGDLYTSLIPNLLVGGMKEALKKTEAKKIYLVNVMTKFGETNNFKASDFVRIISDYLGKNVLDYAVINNKKPPLKNLSLYVKEGSDFVEPDLEGGRNKKMTIIKSDLLRSGKLIRHDPKKLGKLIKMII